jgi:hypothetical protein
MVRPSSVASLASTDQPGQGLRYFRLTSHWFLNHLELMKGQSSAAAAGFFAWSWRQLEPAAVSTRGTSAAAGAGAD